MKEKTKSVIIDIVPIAKISLSRDQFFCYLNDTPIKPGSLVSIPFSKRTIEGIVIQSRSDFSRLGNIQLKKVEKVLEENFLNANQLELAQFISDYYLSPLGVILKSFIPKRTRERNKNQETRNKIEIAKNIILTREQKEAIKKISKFNPPAGGQNSKFLLYGPSGSGKTEIYLNAIKNLKASEQALVILPELTLTPQAIERYGVIFGPENISVINSKISKGKYYSEWQKIKSGQAKVIIGSRMAIFLPFQNLKMIVIDEEHDISFKQWDMNPRYDARTVAEKLAEIHQAKIIRGSATPSLESFYKAENKKYQLIKLPPLNLIASAIGGSAFGGKNQKLETSIELVDMKKERWVKNYSTISKKLKSEIAFALKHGFQTILFINRQGLSTFSICSACKTVLKCPKCDRALVFDNSGTYNCIHCTYKSSVIPECTKCHGIAFQNIGVGTQKVEREVQNLFPSAKIIRVDNQTNKVANFQTKVYEDFKNKKYDILIGTQMISKGWDLPNVSLVGIIDGDAMFSLPDFSTYERAFQTILQVSGRHSRPGAKISGLTLIQTFNPEQKVFKLLAEKKLEEFYTQEFAERKSLHYPPFGHLIKLIFQDYSIKKSETETQKVYALLEKENSSKIFISEPKEAYISKIRGRFREQIIIKIKEGQLPEKIKTILQNLPTGWLIDVDPISII